ncbi:hypothetical protein C8Q78DRAFT_801936 [Trametes maxima]|nr:hypothetical protein C8Q78DRAFT_801936 [Trametes maxima]
MLPSAPRRQRLPSLSESATALPSPFLRVLVPHRRLRAITTVVCAFLCTSYIMEVYSLSRRDRLDPNSAASSFVLRCRPSLSLCARYQRRKKLSAARRASVGLRGRRGKSKRARERGTREDLGGHPDVKLLHEGRPRCDAAVCRHRVRHSASSREPSSPSVRSSCSRCVIADRLPLGTIRHSAGACVKWNGVDVKIRARTCWIGQRNLAPVFDVFSS